MGKFNEVANTVIRESKTGPKIEDLYKKISSLLSAKGFKAFEQNEILEVVQEAIKLGFKEGYKAAEQNPFK